MKALKIQTRMTIRSKRPRAGHFIDLLCMGFLISACAQIPPEVLVTLRTAQH